MAKIDNLDFAGSGLKRLGVRGVGQGHRLGNRAHAFDDHAKIAKQVGDGKHDPARHPIEPKGQSRRHGNNSDRGRTRAPQPDRPADDRDDQEPVQ